MTSSLVGSEMCIRDRLTTRTFQGSSCRLVEARHHEGTLDQFRCQSEVWISAAYCTICAHERVVIWRPQEGTKL
eukprot:193608-Prorocentrum_lima.AAC.1